MSDLDQQLRAYGDAVERLSETSSPPTPSSPRFAVGLAVAAAVAILIVLVVVVIVADRSDDSDPRVATEPTTASSSTSTTAEPAGPDVVPGEWRTIDDAVRLQLLPGVVSVGDSAIVSELDRAQSIDPIAGTATDLPAPPRSLFYASGVWTGTEAIFTGFDIDTKSRQNLIAYNPGTGRWREFAAAPGQQLTDHMFMTTSGLVFLGPDRPWILDLATGSWSSGAVSPALGRSHPAVVSTGEEVVVYGGCDITFGSGQCDEVLEGDEFTDGAIYDPRSDRWRTLGASPLPKSDHPVAAWNGAEVVVFAGEADASTAASLDPVTGRWTRLPDPPIGPRRYSTAAATGDGRVVVFGGSGAKDGAIWDPAIGRWALLPDAPEIRERHRMVVVGSTILVVGNGTSAQLPLAFTLE